MVEDFAMGQENVYLTHIEDVQHVLSIHKYDQAYHDKRKKQNDDCNKGCTSSKNYDPQPMECTLYSGNVLCTNGRALLQVWCQVNNKCTKTVPSRQW